MSILLSKLAIYGVNTAKLHVTQAMECIFKVFNRQNWTVPKKELLLVCRSQSMSWQRGYPYTLTTQSMSFDQCNKVQISDLDRREEENIVNQSLLFWRRAKDYWRRIWRKNEIKMNVQLAVRKEEPRRFAKMRFLQRSLHSARILVLPITVLKIYRASSIHTLRS